MNAETGVLLPLATAGLVVAFRFFFLVRRLWNYPLNHGPGYFLGVAVAPGFYEGPGGRWLKQYRTLLLIQHLILLCAFLVPVVLGRWNDLPVMAPVDVFTFFSLIGGYTLWARRKLGAQVPALASVAVPLEVRRLADYISWPREAMLVTILAFSWLALFTWGDAEFGWREPILMTYGVGGLFPAMILLARNSFPLPPERTEEHYRWLEAGRRYSLRVMESMRWFLVVVLACYAVRHGLPGAANVPGLRWALVGVSTAVGLVMMGVLIRGSGRLARMGRDLRPVGSWAGPFQPARRMLRGGLTWSVLYCSGLVALLVFLRR